MKTSLPIVMALSAVLWAAPVSAEAIYRCGDSYSQKPCPGGTVVQADDPRSASQGLQTRQAAQRDAKAADAMEKARLKEEAKPAQVYIPTVEKEATTQGTSKNTKAKTAKKPAHFTAVAPPKPGQAPKKPAGKAQKKKAAPV